MFNRIGGKGFFCLFLIVVLFLLLLLAACSGEGTDTWIPGGDIVHDTEHRQDPATTAGSDATVTTKRPYIGTRDPISLPDLPTNE